MFPVTHPRRAIYWFLEKASVEALPRTWTSARNRSVGVYHFAPFFLNMKAAGVDLAPFAEGHDGRRKATESKQAGAEYSPLSASFRQGEMLKLMVSGRDNAACSCLYTWAQQQPVETPESTFSSLSGTKRSGVRAACLYELNGVGDNFCEAFTPRKRERAGTGDRTLPAGLWMLPP